MAPFYTPLFFGWTISLKTEKVEKKARNERVFRFHKQLKQKTFLYTAEMNVKKSIRVCLGITKTWRWRQKNKLLLAAIISS
jgi:hypothetical protein